MIRTGEADYETRALIDACHGEFDEVLRIDPMDVACELVRGREHPTIWFGDRDISSLSMLIVRDADGLGGPLAVVTNALDLAGCRVADPLNRHSPVSNSKALGLIRAFRLGIGTTTFIAFREERARALVARIPDETFPLLTKPAAGRQGKGIRVAADRAEMEVVLHEAFADQTHGPPLIQQYMDFVEEYRVLMVEGAVLGMTRREAAPGNVAANVAQNGTMIPAEDFEVVEFAYRYASHRGMLGVDVGRDSAGELHLIESNRAPQWRELERATNQDVARRIVGIYSRKTAKHPGKPRG